MLLILDNYDSFVFNVARYCTELGQDTRVLRNDAMTLAGIEALAPAAILLSPGPGAPQDAGISLDVVARFSGRIPLLGVCLGHQCIGAAFGGRIARAAEPMHGRASAIRHGGGGLFHGLPDPVQVGRYHSLIVEESPALARHMNVSARSPRGEVMALAHRSHPTYGVQFHPESILSEKGHTIFRNFFHLAAEWRCNAVA